ncbi:MULTISPECIES: DNA endonuclease SmrA [Aliagarivorans]|uniref:DNA endonuclease SmrA n=1 Tax=Aliagarivorans TaxID=882379 RepID=UPI000405C264|nr:MULTISPECIES: DNA endonuclease SmrA [Aliagarivorans]
MSDDFDLFQQEMAGITPIKQDALPQTKRPLDKQNRLARQQAAEHSNEPDKEYLSLDYVELIHPEDTVAYKKDGVQEGVFKKLRLGKYEVQARLDLHQHRLEQARTEILNFIKECQRLQLRSVLIVHGKGRTTQPPALMKSYVSQWLTQIDQVLATHSAIGAHGGTGALYVLLKKGAEQKLENRERHARRLA